ncbi:hypothetical protein [Nocardia otitidiscaviarum]|uniref:hypothetical protein n=1 Tax=Nocardia otitidiscaviarum TaxID=1823 RepID=UPI00245714D6|nr:hypothetical protein [Nocardia otitidiscaviarum]
MLAPEAAAVVEVPAPLGALVSEDVLLHPLSAPTLIVTARIIMVVRRMATIVPSGRWFDPIEAAGNPDRQTESLK